MTAKTSQESSAFADAIDQRVRLHDVSWADYEALLRARGEQSGVRVSYLEGELELMTPSVDHESLKKRLARLIEAYAEEADIELEGFGSWTVKSEHKKRGVEADECYVIGPITEPPRIPDIAVEVVIVCEVDLAHATGAQTPQDRVVGELLSDQPCPPREVDDLGGAGPASMRKAA